MAMLLGFVIATPLELKLFEKEINAKISNQIAVINNTIIETGENDPIVIRLKNEKEEINTNIENRKKLLKIKEFFGRQQIEIKMTNGILVSLAAKKVRVDTIQI